MTDEAPPGDDRQEGRTPNRTTPGGDGLRETRRAWSAGRIDRDRGEPLAAGDRRTAAGRALVRDARPLAEWTTRPRILVTNDDGIESRGLLALKQALEPIGRRVRGGTRDQPVGRGPPEDVHATAPRAGADARRRASCVVRGWLAHRRREPRVPGLLRHRLRPGRLGHQLRRQPGRRRDLLGHRQRGHGGGHQRVPRLRDVPGVLPASRLHARGPRWRTSSRSTSSSTACRPASCSTSTCPRR